MRMRKFKRLIKHNKMELGTLTVSGEATIGTATVTTLNAAGGTLDGITAATGLGTLVALTGTITSGAIATIDGATLRYTDGQIARGDFTTSIRIPINVDITGVYTNLTGSIWASGGGDYFFVNCNGTWKSAALG